MKKGHGVLWIVFLALFLVGFTGCANQVGENNVPKIADVIEITLEGLVRGGLEVLESQAPLQVAPTVADLEGVIEIGERYRDGEVSIEDVGQSLEFLFNNLNTRFSFVDPDDVGVSVLRGLLETGVNLADIYFNSYVIPEDGLLYVKAVINGIENGLEGAD